MDSAAYSQDLATVWLTLKLATIVTLLLLVVGTPIAWWLARTKSMFKGVVGAIVALPLVLPPTVLGFYLLLTMGPNGPVGQLTQLMGIGLLPFTFPGLVIASVFYSLPSSPRFTLRMDNLSPCKYNPLEQWRCPSMLSDNGLTNEHGVHFFPLICLCSV